MTAIFSPENKAEWSPRKLKCPHCTQAFSVIDLTISPRRGDDSTTSTELARLTSSSFHWNRWGLQSGLNRCDVVLSCSTRSWRIANACTRANGKEYQYTGNIWEKAGLLERPQTIEGIHITSTVWSAKVFLPFLFNKFIADQIPYQNPVLLFC